ncbi:MAG TPA: nuclear transport factor 2 family protein [Steroidobacteraceae bacterium]|nr:nuclear transport factor 2 family protein [Steroidobacteraceae bacterium]
MRHGSWIAALTACMAASFPLCVLADDTASTPAQQQVFAAQRDIAQQQVLAAERDFARSMADRDRAAFARFVADEAIFFGAGEPLRGKAQVVEGWSNYFEGTAAPFSWAPDQVEVLASGTLALSTGLVRDPQGKVVARFNSVWRLEAPGEWRVVFDKGSPPGPKDVDQ